MWSSLKSQHQAHIMQAEQADGKYRAQSSSSPNALVGEGPISVNLCTPAASAVRMNHRAHAMNRELTEYE